MNESSSPRLLDRVRLAIRMRGWSYRTEESYVATARRFIYFQGKRHPAELVAAVEFLVQAE